MPTRASTPENSRNTPATSVASRETPSTSASGAALFRRLALGLPGTIEASHVGAPDFRVNGRIFATLAYEAKALGTVKLTSEQQAACLEQMPEYFTPAPGKWGRNGTSLVRLDAPEEVIAGALTMAHRNVAQQSSRPERSASRLRTRLQ